jgi:hypothetical protein
MTRPNTLYMECLGLYVAGRKQFRHIDKHG